jgi:hypothetical protein
MISQKNGKLLFSQRAVQEDEGKTAANIENLIFSEVSAKTGKDVNELFTNYIYPQIIEKFKLKMSSQQNSGSPNEEVKETNKNNEEKHGKKIQLSLTEESNDSERKPKKKCC